MNAVFFWLFSVVCLYRVGGGAEPMSSTSMGRDNKGVYQYKIVDTLTTRWDTIIFSVPTKQFFVSSEIKLSVWKNFTAKIDSVKFFVNGSNIVNRKLLTTTETDYTLSFVPGSQSQNKVAVCYKVTSGSLNNNLEIIYIRPQWISQN